ncbi:hypothetical protein ACFE04_009391 [Oxalis oulophora]
MIRDFTTTTWSYGYPPVGINPYPPQGYGYPPAGYISSCMLTHHPVFTTITQSEALLWLMGPITYLLVLVTTCHMESMDTVASLVTIHGHHHGHYHVHGRGRH